MDAVTACRLDKVKSFLKEGADPNYRRFKDEEEPNGLIQPTTPLRLVMFRISDCLLDDNELKTFAEIAKILLKYGADPGPAMEIAEARYGKYNPDIENNAFTNVWHIIAKHEHSS